MGKHNNNNKPLDQVPKIKKVENNEAKTNIIKTEDISKLMYKHGGKFWDTLFILIDDNDKNFIYDFANRIPCNDCKYDFIRILKEKDLDNKSRDQLIKILWDCRGELHGKYKEKSLQSYMDYLNCK